MHHIFLPRASRVLGCALLLMGASCKEYPYRHEVAGTIVDEQGHAIAKAIVARVTDKGDPYGHDELYLRTSDADGHFRFESEGKGPSPLASSPWHIKVTVPARAPATFDLTVPWSDAREPCFGYCKRDIDLRMAASPSAPTLAPSTSASAH